MYTEKDLYLLEQKGISIEQIETQLEHFRKGFPYLEIVSAARVDNGILKVDEKNQRITENNPKITPFINIKLAEGIYLLNIPLDEEWQDSFGSVSSITLK